MKLKFNCDLNTEIGINEQNSQTPKGLEDTKTKTKQTEQPCFLFGKKMKEGISYA